MRVSELRDLLTDLIEADNNPLITHVTKTENRPPSNHGLLQVWLTDGCNGTVMVRSVSGSGVPSHQPFHLPEVAL